MLGRIRGALGRTESPDATRIAAEAEALLSLSEETQPSLVSQDLVNDFIAKVTSERLSATVDLISDDKDIPEAVHNYLSEQELDLSIALAPDPTLQALDWLNIETTSTITPNQGSAVSRARWGIAETGSLVLLSSPTQPTLFAFLPLRHIVVLPKANVVGHMENFWREFRNAGETIPRNINFVTGVSGTADIESKLVRGAHGPRQLHILLTS